MSKILVILKYPLAAYPPLMTIVNVFSDISELDIKVICQSAPESFVNNSRATWEFRPLPSGRVWHEMSYFFKLSYSWLFRRRVERFCEKYQPDLIWVGSAETGWLFYKSSIFKKYRTVAHILELYDSRGLKHILSRWLCRNSDVVLACEENRAWIMRVWYGLSATPCVLPNCPVNVQQETRENLPIVNDIKARIGGRFAVLYQGAIKPERAGFFNIVRAVEELDDTWVFVCMGQDHLGVVDELAKRNKRFIYVGYLTAPDHLNVTRLAKIGVVTYEPHSLNTVFCAPNKTWEYAAFGLPLICADLPGLKMNAYLAQTGLSVDFSNVEAVKEALVEIRKNYSRFSANARRYFEGYNGTVKIKTILKDALQRHKKHK